jgi:cell filamentation protein
MYDIADDLYCYPNTKVLRNIPGFRMVASLRRYEIAMSAQRAEEPLPSGRLSVRHYCAVHRHLFQDVYAWAGKFRKVRIAKDGSMFCYPEHIEREMRKLFTRLRKGNYLRGLSEDAFAVEAARFLATLNAIHPFRDGNGRTQLAFLALIAHRAGRPMDFTKLRPRRFLAAMIASFHGRERRLVDHLRTLVAQQ